LALAGRVPVVATISLIAKQTLVKAVKEKAAAFVVLPATPQTIRETLRSVGLSEDEGQFPSAGKTSMGTDYLGEKGPAQELFARSRQ